MNTYEAHVILIWPTLVLVAPLIVTFTSARSAWTWLSLAVGLVVVWGIMLIVTWEWANGRSGGIFAMLMQPRASGSDQVFHDTYYVTTHLQSLASLAIPAAIIGAVQFIPAHPKRTRIDIGLFWASITAIIAATAGPALYFRNGGMPRRYIEHQDTFLIVNTLSEIAALICLLFAFIALARPFWSWWRTRGGPPHAL